jgi:polysaccharide export outer membrane protein
MKIGGIPFSFSSWICLAIVPILSTVAVRSQALPPASTPAQQAKTYGPRADEFLIGPGDLLEISVFEAPEMNRTLRVSASGEISLELLDPVKASGLTPLELELVLQEQLRRKYMKDPHVEVLIRELQSHPVSVLGAVKQPGVFQIQGTKNVIEMLSLAQGLTDDAGDTVLIVRGGGRSGSISNEPQELKRGEDVEKEEIEQINLKDLLDSRNPSLNVAVRGGDIVKVPRAGIVYVVGEVKKPGGFVLKNNEDISVLQALALAEGLTRTSAKGAMRIIRTDPGTEKRIEIPVDLGKILNSKAPDLMLQPKDIVFVPNSTGKTVLYRGADAALVTATGAAIYGRY